MKIMIMCGGRGKRLGHLTNEIPKPLIKLNNKTILEIKLEEYINQGFKDIIICLGYKSNLIREVVGKYAERINIEYSDSGENAGILKRIYDAQNLFDESVLVTYGDTYTNMNLNELIDAHEKGNTQATIVTASIQNPFGLVDIDADKKVTYFKEKPILPYYIGYAIISKKALELAPSKVIEMPDGEGLVTFYKILIALGNLGAFSHKGLQITFNTPEELKVAEKELIQFYTTTEAYQNDER